ncbi:unnamed protein product [Owenia fusiformis]|uniref:Uncharacterized protein n=1 Tax=Owenia fusiformis TaxID=6347 RepID=A0A8S4NEQ2_OWEFU|nr:unnamed protein product [Owenia fusiformis]
MDTVSTTPYEKATGTTTKKTRKDPAQNKPDTEPKRSDSELSYREKHKKKRSGFNFIYTGTDKRSFEKQRESVDRLSQCKKAPPDSNRVLTSDINDIKGLTASFQWTANGHLGQGFIH